jgi:hypothetical protein
MTNFPLSPIPLEGPLVCLEPLSLSHSAELAEAGNDPALWRYMLYGNLSLPGAMQAWVQDILQRQAAGPTCPSPFATNRADASPGRRATSISAPTTGGWKSAEPGTRLNFSAPASTPSANTCCCATPSRRSAVSACNSRPTLATNAPSAASNASGQSAREFCATTCCCLTATNATRSISASSTASGRGCGNGSKVCFQIPTLDPAPIIQ